MDSSVTLSIVMPFFNCKDLVAEMIDSILANDFQDWELLAVDDGSDMETKAFLLPYSEKDARIRFIVREELPKGAPTCRNIGLREAKGKYIVFFDSDDYITPTCLQTRVRCMEESSKSDFMVFPSGLYIDNRFQSYAPRFLFGYPIYKDDIKGFASRTLPFVVCNNIYRRESLNKHGLLWDTKLKSLQDADFNLQALLSDMKYEYAHCVPDYGYRIGTGNSVSKKIVTEEHYQSHLHALEKFYIEIQKRFGHRYDRALYHGVLYVYILVFGDGLNIAFARRMVRLVRMYSKWYGWMLGIQVECSIFLGHFLPKKRARQIPILSFLVQRSWREQWKRRKIKKLLIE